MNARALLSAVFAVLLVGCPSVESGSFADPRLGVLVFETNDRTFGRVSPDSALVRNDGHVTENRFRIAVADDSTVFIVLGHDAGRPFGTNNDVTASHVVVKKVSPSGAVSELPSPALGSGSRSRFSSLQIAGDGLNPFLVDVDGPLNPAGRYVDVTSFDGSTWQTVSFVRSDRARSDVSSVWDQLNDQVRVLHAGLAIVQHGDTLLRQDGVGWREVTLPANAKEVRLGNADATRVRAYWVTTDGAIETDVLNADGSWAGTIARLRRGTAATLKNAWGFAGDLDTFTLHFVSGTEVVVLRHENGKLRQASTRPITSDEQQGKAFLFATRHPQRSAFLQAGTLTASFGGKETGPLGTVLGFTAPTPVTCEGDVTVKEGQVIAKDGAKCVPRTLDLLDFRLSPDVLTKVEFFSDGRQDATLRYYLKRTPLPSSSTDVTKNEPTDAGFPGESLATMTPPDALVLSGHVLVPGASEHSATTCVLYRRSPRGVVETVQTDVDGQVSFSPVERGDFEVQCNRTGFSTYLNVFSAADIGEVALDAVLVSPLVADNDTPLPDADEFERDGGALLRRSFSGTTVLTTALAAGDAVRFVGGQPVWKEASGVFRSSAASASFATPRDFSSFRFINSTLAVSTGVPDGVTALSWTLGDGVSPLLASPAVGVTPFAFNGTCSGTLVWTLAAPGDVRVQRAGCAAPLALQAGTLSATPAPPLKSLTFLNSAVVGFAGDDCGAEGGFTRACPAHGLFVQTAGPLVSVELSSTALDVRTQLVTFSGSRLLVLERTSATTGTLKASAFNDWVSNVVVQTDVPLPGAWLSGETPITLIDGQSQRFLVRTDTEVFASLGTAGSWSKVASNVRAVFAGGLVLQNDGTLLRVKADGTTATLGVKGNDNLRFNGNTLLTDAATMVCPDGSTCPVIQRLNLVDGTFVSLAAGRLTPDFSIEPRRFGQATPRTFTGALLWPSRRASIAP